MGSIGMSELLIILLILLLLFGATKLPQLARALGQAKREFEEAVHESKEDSKKAGTDDTEGARPRPASRTEGVEQTG